MKNVIKQSSFRIITLMTLFFTLGTTVMAESLNSSKVDGIICETSQQQASCTLWDISSSGNWQLKGGSIDYNTKEITFTADEGNRCNPYSKTTHTVNSKSIIYYKVKAEKAGFSIKDAKITIYIPDYSLNGEEGTLTIKQLKGYEVGKDKDGFAWIAFDLSKLGADNKKQGVYAFDFQVKGGQKVTYTSKDTDSGTYNKVLKDLKKNEYKGNRFDFVLISKLDKDQGSESFVMGELGDAESLGELQARMNK